MKTNWVGIGVGIVLIFAFAIAIRISWDDRQNTVKASETAQRSQHSGVGFTRSIDWYHRSLIFETDDGSQKSYWPLCDASSVPVWQGEHCEFNFRWTSGVNYTPEHGTGCYSIDWVKHLPPDVALP